MEGNTVNFAAVTGHFHVGSNMPGYLPETDVFCAENLELAGQYLADEIERSQEMMAENCEGEGETPDSQDMGSACCAWCAEYWSMQTVISGIRAVEHDVLHEFIRDGGYTYHHTPPTGAPVVFWITNVAGAHGNIETCDIYRDQENPA